MFDIEEIKNIAVSIGVVVALFTLIKGVIEYIQQGKQKRAEQFFELRKKLKENDIFKRINELTEIDSPELLDVPFPDKRDFLGLFEEVAIMMNSGLIKKDVAHYMFGYYAVRCWESENFWHTVNKHSIYWIVFRDFSLEMKKLENRNMKGSKRITI